MTVWLLILLSSLLTCAGQLLQKRAAIQLASQGWALRRLVRNTSLLLAVLCLALGAAVWLLVLRRIDVGLAYPMLSLNFIWVTLAAAAWFGERADLRHWTGIACIVLGVLLLGVSH